MHIFRYPAVISLDSNTGLYSVEFVDFPGVKENGVNGENVGVRAKEILYVAMDKHLETSETLPIAPSHPKKREES